MGKHQQAGEVARAVVQKTEALSTTSATPAGQADRSTEPEEALVDTINQVFALFRLNYHNQYYAAWSDSQQLGQVKRLWLEALSGFSADLILRGARRAIEESEYLPNLKRMLGSCAEALAELGLPTPERAYEEACLAPSPKLHATWSHPAVYLAGRDYGWHNLANLSQQDALPGYRESYQHWVSKVLKGEAIAIPERAKLPESSEASMSLDDRKQALKELRTKLGI